MSNRIQSARNKVGTASVSIGYVPNKTIIQPLTGTSQGINLPSNLQVNSLTANGRITTYDIIANNIFANSITTVSTLTGLSQGTFIQTLSAESGAVNVLRVKDYLYSDLPKIVTGKKVDNINSIELTFTNKNKLYTFGLSAGNTPFVKIYDIYNVSEPNLLFVSNNVFRSTSYDLFAIDSKTNHLFYVSENSKIVCYNLNTNNVPLSTGIIDLGAGNSVGSITINDTYLYTEIIPQSGPTRLGIYNISNPSTLTFTGSCNLFGRKIVGAYDRAVVTHTTILTSGDYVDLAGIIDTSLKHAPFRLNETRFAIADYQQSFGKFKNYFYTFINDSLISACRMYFYDVYNFLQDSFRINLTPATSATLRGYENLGSKTFQNNRLYIASSGQIGLEYNKFPKGFSVWDFSNINYPVSSFFWNDLINLRGPNIFYDNNQGALLTTTLSGGVNFLQPFYTYNTNFDSLKVNAINSDNFDTKNFNTENVNFVNSVGTNLSATNIVSNDVLPVLPVPKIILKGTSILNYGANTMLQVPVYSGGTFQLLRSPKLLVEDITQETLNKYKVFLEIVIFRKKKKRLSGPILNSYTYASPANSNVGLWQQQGFLNRSGTDDSTRTNYIPITAVRHKEHINLSSLLDLRLRERNVNYLSLSAQGPHDYSTVTLLCPYGNTSNSLSDAPRYPYTRIYKPLYVAFRYIAWLPNANNNKGQIISGPLSPVLRIANNFFPFYTNHYESSIKGFPVASLSPHYVNDFNNMKNTFKCNFC